MLNILIGIAIGLMVGGPVGAWVLSITWKPKSVLDAESLDAERRKIEELKSQAETQAAEVLRTAEESAKAKAREREEKLDRELNSRRGEVKAAEGRIRKREEELEKIEAKTQKALAAAEDREKTAEATRAKLDGERQRLEEARKALLKRTEEVSGMTQEQARKTLLETLEGQLRAESSALIHRIETETNENAERKARQIITLAAQRVASEQTSEITVSVVPLPNEEMKGRIIGREGRNIRTLEQATGVNFIIDDTPEAVVLSCFDPMRREIARLVLDKLIQDGRIHPARIEEMVDKTRQEVENAAREAAEKACIELGIYDLHPELVKLMGRLRFRTSYGQNVLKHSIECSHIAEILSSELGLDARLSKRATFLHDIGKAVSHEMEGTHAAIGAELARKHKERPEVVHAIEAHHFEVEPKTLTAMIVITADSISAARPGARRESLEAYIKRLESLEAIANSFEGVERSFAIQAGREVRIVVEPDRLNDNECAALARDVTRRIESELQYPGQIKVTVLREVRKTEYAR